MTDFHISIFEGSKHSPDRPKNLSGCLGMRREQAPALRRDGNSPYEKQPFACILPSFSRKVRFSLRPASEPPVSSHRSPAPA